MSFNATLKLDSGEYRVLHCSYSLQRDIDFSGRPSSDVRGGTITVEIESSGDTSFFEWMTNPFTQQSGSIVFKKRNEDSTMKEMKFTDAYLVGLDESYDAVGDNPMTERLTFSAKTIALGNGEHENDWPSS
ncbi:MAG: type VI secretion system tube protein TssD [Bacteroidota bacterium]